VAYVRGCRTFFASVSFLGYLSVIKLPVIHSFIIFTFIFQLFNRADDGLQLKSLVSA